MTDANMQRYLEHVATIGPCYLHVYPSSLNALVSCIRRHELRVPTNIRGILAGSENVYAGDREADPGRDHDRGRAQHDHDLRGEQEKLKAGHHREDADAVAGIHGKKIQKQLTRPYDD